MMRRWHKEDCQTPEVVTTNSHTLHCRSCSARPNLQETSAPAVDQRSRFPPQRTENKPLEWPSKARYLGEFSSAAGGNQPPRKASRVDSRSDLREIATRPEILFQDEVRLVRLMPCSHPDEPIRVMFEKAHLREQRHQPYDAVSYTTAGGSSSWKPIFVGQFWDIIHVHENCALALQAVRNLVSTPVLWVDELCIDLDDIHERSHQSSLVREIYSNAENVITFIGDCSDNTELVLGILKEAGQSGFAEMNSPEAQDAWRHFSSLPIFSRVWVLQELLVGRQTIFLSQDATFLPRRAIVTDISDSPHRSVLSCLINLKRHFELLDVLIAASNYECSDPRDKVFGVLGLIDDTIRPDYSLSVEDVYTGVAACLATYFRDMRFLNLLGSEQSNFDLPSWVPDWTQRKSLPSHEDSIEVPSPDDDGRISFSFHGLVSNNIEVLVDPKARALQCSAIRLCPFNSRWNPFLSRDGRVFRRGVYPRTSQGVVSTARPELREYFDRDGNRDQISVFLLQGMDYPFLLQYLAEKEAYKILTTSVVFFRHPSVPEVRMPWDDQDLTESTPQVLDIYPLTDEDMNHIADYDSRTQRVIQKHQRTTLDPDYRTFMHSTNRILDLIKLFFLELPSIEKQLRDSWKAHESRLGWMFQDHSKLWAFVDYLEEQDSDIRGTAGMPGTNKFNDTFLSPSRLPSKYTWDLERFCLSFVSGSSEPPPGYENADPGDLIAHIVDIRAWAETTEKLLKYMAYTQNHMSSSWSYFPGNDMARLWLAPFETGMWTWQKFRASLEARQEIWEMLIPKDLDPRVNYNIKTRLIMSQAGLKEEQMQIRIV